MLRDRICGRAVFTDASLRRTRMTNAKILYSKKANGSPDSTSGGWRNFVTSGLPVMKFPLILLDGRRKTL